MTKDHRTSDARAFAEGDRVRWGSSSVDLGIGTVEGVRQVASVRWDGVMHAVEYRSDNLELYREGHRPSEARPWATTRTRCAALLRECGWIDSDADFQAKVEALYCVLEGREPGPRAETASPAPRSDGLVTDNDQLRRALARLILVRKEGAIRATAKKLGTDYESDHCAHGGLHITNRVFDEALELLEGEHTCGGPTDDERRGCGACAFDLTAEAGADVARHRGERAEPRECWDCGKEATMPPYCWDCDRAEDAWRDDKIKSLETDLAALRKVAEAAWTVIRSQDVPAALADLYDALQALKATPCAGTPKTPDACPDGDAGIMGGEHTSHASRGAGRDRQRDTRDGGERPALSCGAFECSDDMAPRRCVLEQDHGDDHVFDRELAYLRTGIGPDPLAPASSSECFYGCVSCATPIPSHGMCPTCSRAYAIGCAEEREMCIAAASEPFVDAGELYDAQRIIVGRLVALRTTHALPKGEKR